MELPRAGGGDTRGPRARAGPADGRLGPREGSVGSAGRAPHGACSRVTFSLGWETFLLFVTGINHFHNVGFYEEDSSPGWASAVDLLTLASSSVHREMCETQHSFSKDKFVKFRRGLVTWGKCPLWPSRDNSFCRYLFYFGRVLFCFAFCGCQVDMCFLF